MDGTLDLKPLHGLYQVLNTAGGADLAHPLVCLAQLQRKPPGSRSPSPDPSQLGEVEWVVGLGTQRPAPVREGKKRRKRDETADVWWEARLCGREVEELLQQVDGSAITPEAMVPRVRERWLSGCIEVRGYNEDEQPRGGIELVMRITPSLPLSLVLTPCDEPPVSLVSVLAHVINPYLTASQDHVNAVNTKKQLDRLSTEHDKVRKLLDNERDANKRQRRVPGTQLRHFSGDSTSNGGGAPFARRRSSQEQSQGASQSQGQGQSASQGGYGGGTQQSPTEERELSLSPSKAIPGVTHRGVLKPGDPGYAGSSRRIGRVVEDTPWDEDPPTDSD